MKHTLGCLRRADEKFSMIDEGDKIAVGLSGGKDSALLLHALNVYRKFSRKKYSIVAISVDLGFEGFDEAALQKMCDKTDVELHIVKTSIGKIVFDIRQEKNPCSLCAKLRKGAFYKKAKELNCNKAAFAHNMDDVIETFFMSLIFESRLNTLSPVTYLSKRDITLIRPFIYLEETHIKRTVENVGLSTIKNSCPACGNTKRQEIKELISSFSEDYLDFKKSVIHSIDSIEKYHLWDKTEGKDGVL
ncbi:MAG: tRNA 2-thiocytidine biosynthesis TtcA family protein [Eubacteriales bacterium]